VIGNVCNYVNVNICNYVIGNVCNYVIANVCYYVILVPSCESLKQIFLIWFLISMTMYWPTITAISGANPTITEFTTISFLPT
jgi:hypothetical protein